MMYDLFRAPRLEPSKSTFLMRAPLATISEFLALQRPAEYRIERLIARGDQVVELYDDRRYPAFVHSVTAAVGAR